LKFERIKWQSFVRNLREFCERIESNRSYLCMNWFVKFQSRKFSKKFIDVNKCRKFSVWELTWHITKAKISPTGICIGIIFPCYFAVQKSSTLNKCKLIKLSSYPPVVLFVLHWGYLAVESCVCRFTRCLFMILSSKYEQWVNSTREKA
jgi:hypothetical protein